MFIVNFNGLGEGSDKMDGWFVWFFEMIVCG